MHVLRQFRKSLAAVGALVAVAAVAALASPAPANALLGLGNPCGAQMSHPFAQFGDNGSYTLIPGGSFEPGAPGWSLKGAALVGGNQPFLSTGSRSLYLPAGSSATSPFMCVGSLSPTLRVFGFSSGATTALSVQILAKNALGLLTVLGVGIVYPGQTKWAPTNAALFLQGLGALLTNTTSIAFRFAPVNGSWTIDDTYVDPLLSQG
ncbi:MAG: hypothetical protein ACJ76I_01985 [Gaiellaceae bacterium]